MRNIIIPFLICCLFSQGNTAFSQKKNFKEGYIILNNGDTIRGKIKHLSSMAHAKFVVFTKGNLDNQSKYYPNQLSKYYFENQNYYETDSVPFKRLGGGVSYQKLFLKKLVDGDIELFKLEYRIKESTTPLFDYQTKYYFVRKDNGLLTDLNEENYELKLSKLFKTTCPTSKKNKRFDDEGLATLIMEYSDCLGVSSKLVYSQEKIKKKFSWGLSAGLLKSEILMTDDRFKDFIVEDNKGHDIDIFLLAKINKLFTCRIGLNYHYLSQSSYSNHTVSKFYDNEGEIINLKSNASLAHITMPFQLLVNKRINNLNFYGISGVNLGTTLKNSFFFDKINFKYINNESIQFKERVIVTNISQKDVEYGWFIGGGGEFYIKKSHSIFIEILYDCGLNSFDKNKKTHISHNSITFSLGYNFNRFNNDN